MIYFRTIILTIDEGPSPKLALSEGGSTGNIKSDLRLGFELGHCNHLAMI